MVQIEWHEKVAVITFNDGKVNVLNEDSLSKLRGALKECEEARAAVLTGAGKCFSAGLDLKRLPTLSPDELAGLLQHLYDLVRAILDAPFPVVAAVNGHAIAGGAVITLCCDMAIGVSGDLKIGLSEVAVGMPLPTLVVELARQRLSPTKLVEAVLFGKLYDGPGALEAGYLHHCVEPEKLGANALQAANRLSALPRPAYSETKKALWAHLPNSLGAEAVGSFLTEQAREHMSHFKG